MQSAEGMKSLSPTAEVYGELCTAYDFYNRELFESGLPNCLITLQRKGKVTHGYFSHERFRRHSGDVTDEIAMNPLHFSARSLVEVLQTLVHEMSHLWQAHNGTPGRRGYHNKAWGAKLKELGLYPSSTGKPGGKETGERMSDYVISGGRFEAATTKLLATGFAVSWAEAVELAVAGDDDDGKGDADEKDKSNRVKYTCPQCTVNAWGRPDLALICGKCRLDFVMSVSASPSNRAW